jgi:hypothetical protein
MLNTVTRPFTFPTTCCDEAAESWRRQVVLHNRRLDAGYWQVKMNENVTDRPFHAERRSTTHANGVMNGFCRDGI